MAPVPVVLVAPHGASSPIHPGPCLSLLKLSTLLRSKILPDGATVTPAKSAPAATAASVLALTSSPVAHLSGGAAGGGGGNAIILALAACGGVAAVPAEEEWLEFEEACLVPTLILGEGGKKATAATCKELEARVGAENLAGRFLLGGALGLADVVLVCTLTVAKTVDPSLSLGPATESYLSGLSKSAVFAGAEGDIPGLLPPPPADPSTLPLTDAVSAVFAAALEDAFPQANSLGIALDVKRCSNFKFGDYQCNNAMGLFQKFKTSNPGAYTKPHDVANVILGCVAKDNIVLDQLKVTGPGFIMCRIRGSFLSSRADAIVKSGKVAPPKSEKRRVIVDFSSPNIAKEMHVGHLRSTIIGESVCRILEYCGHDVDRVNHVGDWGTQFGMLIQYLKEEFPNFENDQPNITDLTQFYKNAKMRFDENADFKKTAQLNVVALQSGDVACKKIWQILCDISRKEFKKVYNRLDVKVEECGESFYNDKISDVIKEFESKKLISIEEGGAKCIFLPSKKFPIPLMVQKSDGGFGYDSTDMAALKYRLCKLKADRVVYITDYSQANHFHMCFEAAEMMGWVTPDGPRLDHIGFGTVQGEDGKRFKTRSGDTVRLVDLLDEAVKRMKERLLERISAGSASITVEEVDVTAAACGYGAVKYFDLHRNPTSNYCFSYDRMLDDRGNTAIYLLYAHARLVSICAKAKERHGADVDKLIAAGEKIVVDHPSERNLVFHLEMFSDHIVTTLDDLFPYHICEYLYLTSKATSDFITKCKVLGSPEMNSRIMLCQATAIVMRQCFDLLGIQYVMRI